jgi:hypothetical protein
MGRSIIKARIEADPAITRRALQDRAVAVIRRTNDVTEYFIVILLFKRMVPLFYHG